MAETAESWDGYLPRRAAYRKCNHPKIKKIRCSQTSRELLETWSVLISHMEIQRLEFAQMVFFLAFVQYFLTIFPSLCFAMVICISFHYMLEYVIYFSILIFYRGIRVKRLPCVSEETLDIEISSRLLQKLNRMHFFSF